MQCSVCYTTKNLVYTDCKHDFCEKCIKSWLQIKYNCPVCRRSVWTFTKHKKINKKINKKTKSKPFIRSIPVKTRSKTKENRWSNFSQFIANSYQDMSLPNINIHQKFIIVEQIIKKCIDNLVLIKQMDISYFISIENLLYQLENNQNIIDNNYLDKIKLWKYKLNNVNQISSFS